MKVKFIPDNVEYEIEPNETVLELAQRTGVRIHTVCNGLPSCAECRVKLVEGEYNVMAPSTKELSLIGTGHFIDRRRLSCQLVCFGDITVDTTEQKEKEHLVGVKRPQGSFTKGAEESSAAVTGNLIEQDDQFEKVKLKENPVSNSKSDSSSSGDKGGEPAKSGEGPKRRRRRSRNRHRRN